MRTYAKPVGGLPPQTEKLTSSAIFTGAYAVIPRSVMTDIVTSNLPFWKDTRAWIIARPMTGFSETFSQYIIEIAPGGGSDAPEPDMGVQGVLFVVGGAIELHLNGVDHVLETGGYAYIPAGAVWRVLNSTNQPATFHWIRKRYETVDGIDLPEAFVTSDSAVAPIPMPDTDDAWATTRFVDPSDMRHDMHVNIVTFQPGGTIPFLETHVMEHGLYVLEGKAAYKLNNDWVEVGPGDFMWLRAFCPQACYA
ncbi:MAG: (S)-ureidoglycine aminohydrolase, partial [Rhodobacteraceae bacterium]|nr:(S)-ureidoglycine aminohydrolase [Paracoccaceae bacterium]